MWFYWRLCGSIQQYLSLIYSWNKNPCLIILRILTILALLETAKNIRLLLVLLSNYRLTTTRRNFPLQVPIALVPKVPNRKTLLNLLTIDYLWLFKGFCFSQLLQINFREYNTDFLWEKAFANDRTLITSWDQSFTNLTKNVLHTAELYKRFYC